MISFGNLTVEGFCSIISPTTFNLDNKGIIVIRGKTGSGKTTILSALVWVLYGVNLKEVSDVNTWPKYQPKDYQGTMVSIYFKVDGKLYKIIRCQNYKGKVNGAKGKDNLFFFEDGLLTKIKGRKNIQKEIEKTLKLSYRVFISSVLFGQGLKRLINETNSDQKALFEEIFDVSYTSQAKSKAMEMYKIDNNILSVLNEKKAVLEASLSAYKDNYKMSKLESKRFDSQQKEELDKLNSRLKNYNKKLEELQNDFNINLLSKLKAKVEQLSQKIIEINKAYKESMEFEDIPIIDLVSEVIDLLEKKEYKTCIGKLRGIQSALVSAQKLNEKKEALLSTLSKKKTKLNKLVSNQTELIYNEKQIKTIKADIFELKCKKPSKVKTELLDKIKQIEAELEEVNSLYEPQLKKVEDIKWVIDDALSNHGIKAYLFESSLSSLNKILDSYSDVLELNIQYMIDTSTKKKDFTTVIRFEGQTVLYEELSGGQKQLVHLAMAFAVNQLVTTDLGLNIAFLDEIFENLSEDKIDVVVNLIRHIYKDKSLFIITHQDTLPIPSSKTLYTKRNKGLSSYNY